MKTERPTLNFVNEADGGEVTLAFGYFGDDREPTAALFHGDKLILIPASVLAIAISSGWEDDYSMLCSALKDDSECPHCEMEEEPRLYTAGELAAQARIQEEIGLDAWNHRRRQLQLAAEYTAEESQQAADDWSQEAREIRDAELAEEGGEHAPS